ELRQPEPVQVRLVADDHVVDVREAPDDVGAERGEVGTGPVAEGRHARAVRVEGQDDADAVELRGGDGVPELDRVVRAEGRVAGRPRLRQPDRVETGELR